MNTNKLAALKFAPNYRRSDYSTGDSAAYVMFDGDFVWVCGGNSVRKLRKSDGAVLQTMTVGNSPLSMAHDGIVLWVPNFTDKTISLIRMSDGAVFPALSGLPAKPEGIVWDGSGFWIAMNDTSALLQKYNPTTGAVMLSVTVGNGPNGLCFDGEHVWVCNIIDNTVTKVRASDGAVLQTIAVADDPVNSCFDGEHVWVSSSAYAVTKIRASDGAIVATTSLGTESPRGICFDGDSIWVAGSTTGVLIRLRQSDGAILDTLPVGAGARGICFDGLNMWVANSGTNTVSKL